MYYLFVEIKGKTVEDVGRKERGYRKVRTCRIRDVFRERQSEAHM